MSEEMEKKGKGNRKPTCFSAINSKMTEGREKGAEP